MTNKNPDKANRGAGPSHLSVTVSDPAPLHPHQAQPRRAIGQGTSQRERQKRPRRIRRNALKHGLFTGEMIADRKKLNALMRDMLSPSEELS